MERYSYDNGAAMHCAIEKTYTLPVGVLLEHMIADRASAQCFTPVALWEFHSDGEIGFWAPCIDCETVSVSCPNQYQNEAMDRVSFGAAVTLMAINHLIWALYHRLPSHTYIPLLIAKQDQLRDWVYRDGSTLDTTAIYSFLD